MSIARSAREAWVTHFSTTLLKGKVQINTNGSSTEEPDDCNVDKLLQDGPTTVSCLWWLYTYTWVLDTAQALYFSKITAEPPHKVVLRCCTVRGKECIQKLHCSLFLWLWQGNRLAIYSCWQESISWKWLTTIFYISLFARKYYLANLCWLKISMFPLSSWTILLLSSGVPCSSTCWIT